MTNPKLLEVGARLEKTVQELVDKGLASDDLYSTYEMVAIQILDSEFEDFPECELERYLVDYLSKHQ
ncbi:MAG: hypothetical protein ACJAVI_003162 [Candidatus Azotimanducaceae bacterium]|jgi:hypothetical protein